LLKTVSQEPLADSLHPPNLDRRRTKLTSFLLRNLKVCGLLVLAGCGFSHHGPGGVHADDAVDTHEPAFVKNGWSDRSGASVWTISSSWARRICAESCEPMLAITTTSERTGHWI